MSATVARLILSLTIITATPVVYFVVFFTLEEVTGWYFSTLNLLLCSGLTGLFLVGVWVLIWLRQVRWHGWRMGSTVALIAVLTVACALFALLANELFFDEVGIILASMVWAVGWLAGSTLIWRETRSERMKRIRELGMGTIHCPQCDYNLTGLREARCPECGTQYTLDQLFASITEIRRIADEGG